MKFRWSLFRKAKRRRLCESTERRMDLANTRRDRGEPRRCMRLQPMHEPVNARAFIACVIAYVIVRDGQTCGRSCSRVTMNRAQV